MYNDLKRISIPTINMDLDRKLHTPTTLRAQVAGQALPLISPMSKVRQDCVPPYFFCHANDWLINVKSERREHDLLT